jgi:hypothetical protein
MLKLAVLQYLKQFYGTAGPVSLLVIWGACVAIGWGSVGRHSAIILWLLACAVMVSVLALVLGLVASGRLRGLRGAHRRFEHQGRSDAQLMARITGMRFRAHHLGLSGAVLGAGTLAALSMDGLAISGGVIAVALFPTLVLIWRAWGLNRAVVAGVTFFLQPVVQTTSTGRDASNTLSHAVHVQSALSKAHKGGENGLAAQEFLATVRHKDAFWPDISATLEFNSAVQLKWRLFALIGAIGHMLSAAVVAILLSLFAPVSFFPPLASPLDLMSLMSPPDAQSETPEEKTPPQEEKEDAGADGGEGGEQGEGADGGEGGEQSESADSGEDGEQGESADGGEGDEQGLGADGGEGGEQGESADSGEDGEGADGDEGTGGHEAQVTIQDGEAEEEPEEREVSIGGQGPETDRQEGMALEGQAEPDEGAPQSMTAATLTGAAMGEIPQTETMPLDTNPFSARGVGPQSVEVLQTDIPDFPDNLPEVDPPNQRVPRWILQLEGAIE